jgi:hypothetical protein
MSWNDFFGEVFRNVLPEMAFNILVGLLIIFLGVALGFLTKSIMLWMLKRLKFERLVEQVKLNEVLGKTPLSLVLADIVEALVILAFLVQGLHFMGFHILSAGLASILAWAPNLIAGLILLAIFFVIAKYVERRVAESHMKNAQSLAKYVFGGVLALGAVISLNQAGFDTQFIEQALLIVLFGFALAFALAIGISMGLGLKGNAKTLVAQATKTKKKRKA